jgi:putative Holliday junction resolvase
MPSTVGTIIALDVGERRIGVAAAGQSTRLASPLTTILNDETVFESISRLLTDQHASALVVGLPRGMSGQTTKQTGVIEAFVLRLRQHTDLPIYWQDEALTSRQAEKELAARGKPFEKGEVDALAACYILEDFLKDHFKER